MFFKEIENILENHEKKIERLNHDKINILKPKYEVDEIKMLLEFRNLEYLPTRNQELEGKRHPDTNIPFVLVKAENQDGKFFKVVVPEFKSYFDVKLPENLQKSTDKEQIKECTDQLRIALDTNRSLGKNFNKDQIDQIIDGETPDGYVWHHDAYKGKMQLVDSNIHSKTGHTGGKSIWGGGTDNR